ncbi:hypothetical protein FE257_000161 [Aspergillus nanangensis]|uniref:Oxidoreductase acuF-like C2H2 type zinc-finger domain-containing protein n=1 Tax=Aspergillus nanangensis TaxID=2582783 RepID=A0AAD4GYU5_ASPNN|nr:hypothetical protein FE257_000161 [Aspergillus nanangensis]
MDQSIATLFTTCYSRFFKLATSATIATRTPEVAPSLWEEELVRLRVWAANIGAHQTEQSSLEYRLRDASDVKIQVTQLLRNLRNLLNDLLQELRTTKHDVDADSDTDWGALNETDDFNLTDLQQIHKCIVENVTCLYQMSMIIRRPAHHDRIFKAREEDAAPYRFFDCQHVSSKFPSVNDDLVSRLGDAISKRRAIINYRERHRQKLAHGIDSGLQDGQSITISETVATEFQVDRTALPDVSETSSVTSYAPTLFERANAVAIPPLPPGATDHSSFECPYCYFIITVEGSRTWARHVFHDLLPYVCVFPACRTPDKLYVSRREWFSHVKRTHEDALTNYECVFCQNRLRPAEIEKHLARHLEELALFALPHYDVEDEDPNDVPDHPNKEESGDSATDDDDRPATVEPPVERMRQNEYFVPGDGINRDVIQADICRYLGNDALVRPGAHNGHLGFYLRAYRNLTHEMITDLKKDSALWEAEVSRRADLGYPRGSYLEYVSNGSSMVPTEYPRPSPYYQPPTP